MSGVGAISDMISQRASARRTCSGGGGARSCRGINRFSIQSGYRARIAINHSLTMCLQARNDLGSFILGRRANARGGLDGANGMSGREIQADTNLLSAIAMMIVGALGAGLPIALVIIWLCA
jgi:hypothetical protein